MFEAAEIMAYISFTVVTIGISYMAIQTFYDHHIKDRRLKNKKLLDRRG